MLSVTFFLQHFVWSFMLYIKVMIVTMLKMTVDINYLAYSHPCPFSEFVPFFLLTLFLLVFFSVVLNHGALSCIVLLEHLECLCLGCLHTLLQFSEPCK